MATNDAVRLAEMLRTDLNDASMRYYSVTAERLLTAVRALAAERDAAKQTWRCFHCGFETSDKAQAEAHFGDESGLPPLCIWCELEDSDPKKCWQEAETQLIQAREEYDKMEAERDALKRQVDQQAARIAELETGLRSACDDLQSWGSYAFEYFQEKHDLEGDIQRIKALLEGTK